MFARLLPAALVVLFVLAGCSASGDGKEGGTLPRDGSVSGSDTADNGNDDGGDDGGIAIDAQLPETLPPDNAPAAAVYAHSPDTLYKLDPDTKAITVVGKFSGCVGSVIDIALDAESKMYASTGAFYVVDKATAKCTSIGSSFAAGYGNSLSFVPVGVLSPTTEELVTYNGGDYLRIDVASGKTTKLGALPAGYQSSGDIVSVKGGSTYLTVTGNSCGDCLFEVDPKNGSMIKNWGPLGISAVYGVAYWAGSLYAFNNAGQIHEITFDTGKLVTKEIAIPAKPAGLQFYGAGSTTIAPIVKVK